ncbi:hypothetical protein Tco_0548606 [Tanacetum coccineum]
MSFLSTGIIGYGHCLLVVSSSRSSAILGQMTYLVASSTLDSARTYVMQGAPFTQGTIPSIPIDSSISPEGFLLLVLLLVVIIVTVFIVIVILIVVVDDVSLILKISFTIISFLHRIMLYYPSSESEFPLFATGISLGLVFLLGLLALAMAAVCASRAAVKSATVAVGIQRFLAGVSDVDVLFGRHSINTR